MTGWPRRMIVDRVRGQRSALIDVGLLSDARRGLTAPWLTAVSTPRGMVLTFTGEDGQRWLFRLGRYVPGTGAHRIERPD